MVLAAGVRRREVCVMLGRLHIEMALLSVMGNWLNGSGWVAIMATANDTTEGRAYALLKDHTHLELNGPTR